MEAVQSAVPAFVQQVVSMHAADDGGGDGIATFRLFGVVTKLHANAVTGEVHGGLCTLEPRRNGKRVTIAFHASSFAHRARPLHVGPVEMPCFAAASAKLGTVLYGVATRGARDSRLVFRACTEGGALLALIRLLQSDRKDAAAVWNARESLQLGGAPDRADELVLLGLVLVGDLLAVTRLLEDIPTAATAAAPVLIVGKRWRDEPDEFVRCAALMSTSPILLHRLHNFIVAQCARTAPAALQRRLRASTADLTGKNMSAFRHVRENKFAAARDLAADAADGGANDSDDEWSC